MHVHCKCDSDGSMDGLPRISSNKIANYFEKQYKSRVSFVK